MRTKNDADHMTHALALAARGLGRVWPNPAVGCVIVDPLSGEVVGRGWTQPDGRPHAETEALRQAGPRARGATAYVSLEPCAHHGHTPPCAEALIKAGVGRVVAACVDPDPRVGGQGLAMLKNAGIATEVGVCEAAAQALNAGFIKRVTAGLPLVTLKLATTLDGRIATATGESRWITGEAARRRGHLMRATHDAILIGRRTAERDDPELTCRLTGLEDRSPVRVVVDSALSLSPACQLYATARQTPTWSIAAADAEPARVEALSALGVEIVMTPRSAAGVDLREALRALAGRGITRLLVEGGARIATTLLQAELADRLAWFRASRLLGADGRAAIESLTVDRLADAPALLRLANEAVGEDMLETYLTGR
jgi:diaminohydroxyphosphoribosylaminopyrimidine deaminase/5-amino-6-(5-phosphoribosylamino)uracil reductase